MILSTANKWRTISGYEQADEVIEFARCYTTMQLDGKGEVAEDAIAMLLSGLDQSFCEILSSH